MKAIILYRPNSEFARKAEEYAYDFKSMSAIDIELLDLNSKTGADTAKLYDITQYPSLLVIGDDGQMHQMWQGENFPLKNELMGYLKS